MQTCLSSNPARDWSVLASPAALKMSMNLKGDTGAAASLIKLDFN